MFARPAILGSSLLQFEHFAWLPDLALTSDHQLHALQHIDFVAGIVERVEELVFGPADFLIFCFLNDCSGTSEPWCWCNRLVARKSRVGE